MSTYEHKSTLGMHFGDVLGRMPCRPIASGLSGELRRFDMGTWRSTTCERDADPGGREPLVTTGREWH